MMRAKKKKLIEKKFFARNPFLQNNGITHFAAKIFLKLSKKFQNVFVEVSQQRKIISTVADRWKGIF